MRNSNERKSNFLGMPHGTATNRLRKMVLFALLQKHGENICFKCKERINTVDELTVEHKRRWEGVSIELFWDLKNIAFSHLKCNLPEIYRGGQGKRKVGTTDTAWCMKCKSFAPINEFQKNKAKWNGLQDWCRECMKSRHRT